MQIDIFQQVRQVQEITKEQYKNIDRIIKSDNIDLAYHMMIGFQIPIRDIVKRIVRLKFIPFHVGNDNFENTGVHVFCDFNIFGKKLDFYETVSGKSGVLFDINDIEIETSMYIGESDTYENPLKQKMIKNFSNTIIKNWKKITYESLEKL